jgi:hypothetical protein
MDAIAPNGMVDAPIGDDAISDSVRREIDRRVAEKTTALSKAVEDRMRQMLDAFRIERELIEQGEQEFEFDVFEDDQFEERVDGWPGYAQVGTFRFIEGDITDLEGTQITDNSDGRKEYLKIVMSDAGEVAATYEIGPMPTPPGPSEAWYRLLDWKGPIYITRFG